MLRNIFNDNHFSTNTHYFSILSLSLYVIRNFFRLLPFPHAYNFNLILLFFRLTLLLVFNVFNVMLGFYAFIVCVYLCDTKRKNTHKKSEGDVLKFMCEPTSMRIECYISFIFEKQGKIVSNFTG